jgi:hypothetical protein
MAQRKQPPQNAAPDYLVRPKAQFEAELDERISLGEALVNRPIHNEREKATLYTDYGFWNDYNTELLSRAFNNINNKYYTEYKKSLGFDITNIYREPSFDERVAEQRGDITVMVDRLKKIKGKLGLIDESPGLQPPAISKAADKQSEGLSRLSNVFARFHRVAQTLRHRHSSRETLIIKDEYDVQDLLHSLLHLHFSDIRSEDYSPSYAGGNSRVDFVLKDEKIIVEVKMTNNSLKDKEVGSQLLIDIGRYRGHPDCRVLVVFVYDKEDYIRNKRGMITDLERLSTSDLKVEVFIEPQ